MFSLSWGCTCLLKNAGTIFSPPDVTSLTQRHFYFDRCLLLGLRGFFPWVKAWTTAPQGAGHPTPHREAGPPSQLGNGLLQLACASSSVPVFVCKGRVCQGQWVSGNTFIHGNCGSGEKNKQGEKFQGNWGKTRTKESGEKGSSQAKGKHMEETLDPSGPWPCAKELDRRLPLLVRLFLGQQCHLLLSNWNIWVALLTEETRKLKSENKIRWNRSAEALFPVGHCHVLQLLFPSLGQTQQPEGPIPATPGWWIRTKGSLQRGVWSSHLFLKFPNMGLGTHR